MKDACHPVSPSQAEDSWTNRENGERQGRGRGRERERERRIMWLESQRHSHDVVDPVVRSCRVRVLFGSSSSSSRRLVSLQLTLTWRVILMCKVCTHTHTPLTARGRSSEFLRPDMTRLHFLFFSISVFFSLFFSFFRFFCKQTRVWHFSLKLTVMYNAGNSRIKNTHTMTPPYPPPMALAQLSFMACRLPLLKNYILTLKVQKKVDEEKKIEKKRKKNKFKSFTCSQDMFEVAGEERGGE